MTLPVSCIYTKVFLNPYSIFNFIFILFYFCIRQITTDNHLKTLIKPILMEGD